MVNNKRMCNSQVISRSKLFAFMEVVILCLITFTVHGNIKNPDSTKDKSSIVFFSYTPKNNIGSFQVSIDTFRMLNVEWQGMPLVRQWGEFYGNIKNPWHNATKNENGVPSPRGIFGVPRDVMVRVEKQTDMTEYLWMINNKKDDFLQINRVVTTPNKIASDTILYFRKKAPEAIDFFPVLMPSSLIPGGEMREIAILNKKCTVIYKDGTIDTVVYPDRKKAFEWLKGNIRQLTFHIEKGNITYKFNSSDPLMRLSFSGASHFSIANKSKNRGVLGELKTYPISGTPMIYSMEIDINNSKTVIPPFDLEKTLNFYIPFDIELSNRDGIYILGEKTNFQFNIDNSWNKTAEKLKVKWKIFNYENKIIEKNQKECDLSGGMTKKLNASIKINQAGIFNMEVSLYKNKRLINRKIISFTIVLPPLNINPKDTFFGSHASSYMMRPPSHPYSEYQKMWVNSHFAALQKLGIKEVRVLDWNLAWKNVEPIKGEYHFSPATDELLEMAEKNNITLRFYHVFSTKQPDWVWRKGREFKVFHDNFKAPKKPFDEKEWKLYEDYIYQVAKKYKGKIKFYEIANEPYQLRPWDPVRNEYLKAFQNGIKRGDPAAKVLGASTYVIKTDVFNKIKKFLEYKDSYQYLDIISPHYFISGQKIKKGVNIAGGSISVPEDSLGDMKRLVQLAQKYDLDIFNGEDGRKITSENIFPADKFYDWQKIYINHSVRNYLLHKRFSNIKRICLCWGMGGYIGGFIKSSIFNDYDERIRGEAFWGAGGNPLPWSAAHATLAHFIDGSLFQQQISKLIKDFYCYYFKRGDDNIAVVWMKKGTANWSITLPDRVSCYNIVGEKIDKEGINNLKVSGAPFYLVTKGMSKKAFLKLLNSGRLIPNKYIEIKEVRLSKNKKDLEILIRNLSFKKVTLDFINIQYDFSDEVALQNIVLGGDKINIIKIPMKYKYRDNIHVNVLAGIGKQKYKYEDIVLYPSMAGARGKGYISTLFTLDRVKIDGDLSEWKDVSWRMFDSKKQLSSKSSSNPWHGTLDLSAKFAMMWDDKYLYFGCEVTDDKYINPYDGKKATWAGDSVQFAIDSKMDKNLKNFSENVIRLNLALTKDGPKVLRDTFGKRKDISDEDKGIVENIKFAVLRKGGKIYYELALPLSELGNIKIEEGTVVHYSLLINDCDDPSGGRVWFELTKGLARKKDSSLFKKLVFVKE